MNRLLITVIILFTSVIMSYAQEETDVSPYQKNQFTVAAFLGYNTYVSKSAEKIQTKYELRSVHRAWVERGLALGVEGGWFFSNKWKLLATFGLDHSYRPGYTAVPGVADFSKGGIPAYAAVADEAQTLYSLGLGVNRYFPLTKAPRLAFYAGSILNFSYGNASLKEDDSSSQGISVGETYTWGGSLIVGMEYMIASNLYMGIQVAPFAYNYNITTVKPAPGLSPLKADLHDFNVLGSPTLKLGFNF